MEAILEPSPQMQTCATAAAPAVAEGGKFLTFALAGEEFGVEILKVMEIIGILDITIVPHTAEFVRGVINLRGKIIPVIDLRTKFGLPRAEYDEQTCVIVVDVGTLTGIIVDTVQEVHDIATEDIAPPPALSGGMSADFILGMGKVKNDVKILLNIDRVLNADELVELPQASRMSDSARD